MLCNTALVYSEAHLHKENTLCYTGNDYTNIYTRKTQRTLCYTVCNMSCNVAVYRLLTATSRVCRMCAVPDGRRSYVSSRLGGRVSALVLRTEAAFWRLRPLMKFTKSAAFSGCEYFVVLEGSRGTSRRCSSGELASVLGASVPCGPEGCVA